MYVKFHDVNTYITLRVYFTQKTSSKHNSYYGGAEVTHGPLMLAEFRRYNDEARYRYYVGGQLIKDSITFEEMENKLATFESDDYGKESIGMNEIDMDKVLGGYSLLVQGIDMQEKDSYAWTYEIRKYGMNTYKKYRRGKLEAMDASTAIQEIADVNADLQEVTERSAWLESGTYSDAMLLQYLEKCWKEIDSLAAFEKEHEKLLRWGGTTKKETTGEIGERDGKERARWRARDGNKGSFNIGKYLEDVWREIDGLRQFKYRNEFLRGRSITARALNYTELNVGDLLAELRNVCVK
jgi:hypothetical protein